MNNLWRLYLSLPATGAWNMAVDEAILEHVVRGDSLPTLRLYRWEPPCLSLGRSQPFADISVASLKKNSWDVVRRMTGGRSILHTDELTYAIIAPKDNLHLRGTLLESYQHLAQALLAALKSMGVDAEMNREKANPKKQNNPVCFETPSTYEITVKGKKIIGSAQARQKGGVLQHGSLPLTGDLARITQALNFPDATSRQIAAEKLLSRASTMESALGREVDWGTASRSFIHAFESVLGIRFKHGALSPAEKNRASELIQKKYAHADWTERI
ncbi:MAG: hypothetical protein DRI32_01425 [Chloroflexi bacterium]|nr:MAG: hypothetical protein DRI32_01425 [Chloroflexota bacterium]